MSMGEGSLRLRMWLRAGGPAECSPGREAGGRVEKGHQPQRGVRFGTSTLTPLRGCTSGYSQPRPYGRGHTLSGLPALAMMILLMGVSFPKSLHAQTPQTPALQLIQPPGQAAAPITITLQDALERARKLDVTLQAALLDAQIAGEDRLQARNARLPSATAR